ncbi:DUF2690 domain-containing protein [Peterkaempfera bronchialis]|uniref:helix-turn-helix domain-containing protein n=1 Tax=Peterkaempfera bronchialis TaxID=2126346 RepID=UPI003C3064DE
MARWRPLPGTLDPDLHRLIEQLRRLKDRSGLSLVALAERTPYSKSAWHRYLNGAKFPPRQAVEALGMVAGADAPRLLALWGLAERSRLDAARRYEVTGGPPAPCEHSPAPEPPPPVPVPAAALPAPAAATPAAVAVAVAPPAETPLRGLLRRRRPPGGRLIPAAPALALAALLAALLYALGPGAHGARIVRDTVRSLLGSPARTAVPGTPGTPVRPPTAHARTAARTACRAAACQGRDPDTEGCTRHARTVSSAPLAGVELRLRYSDRCRAAWADITLPVRPLPSGETATLAVADRGGVLVASRAGRRRSPMLATVAPHRTRACAAVGQVQACTGDPGTAAPLLLPTAEPSRLTGRATPGTPGRPCGPIPQTCTGAPHPGHSSDPVSRHWPPPPPTTWAIPILATHHPATLPLLWPTTPG